VAQDVAPDTDRALAALSARMAARSRQRRYRQRQREGLVTLSVTVDEASITALLTSAGYLSPIRADDQGAIASALEHMLASIKRHA
jgi:hypothetical protein